MGKGRYPLLPRNKWDFTEHLFYFITFNFYYFLYKSVKYFDWTFNVLTYTYNSVFCIGVKKCYISEFLDSVMALYYDLLSFQLLGLDGSLVFLVGKLNHIEFYFPLFSVWFIKQVYIINIHCNSLEPVSFGNYFPS